MFNMISLKDYVNEQLNGEVQPINEMFLTCLCYLAAISIGIKVVKGLGNGVAACWNTVIGDELKKIGDSKIDDSEVISEARKKLTAKNLFPLQVPNEKILRTVIAKTKPKEGTNTESGHGLWTLSKKITDDKELAKVNKGNMKPQYAAIIKKETYEIIGMFGFSIDYWKDKQKNGNSQDKKLAKEFNNYIHIIDIDICPEYDIDTIDEFVWDTIFKVQKELKTRGITIWCDDDKEKSEYTNKGFELVKGHQNLMFCNNKDYKEEE